MSSPGYQQAFETLRKAALQDAKSSRAMALRTQEAVKTLMNDHNISSKALAEAFYNLKVQGSLDPQLSGPNAAGLKDYILQLRRNMTPETIGTVREYQQAFETLRKAALQDVQDAAKSGRAMASRTQEAAKTLMNDPTISSKSLATAFEDLDGQVGFDPHLSGPNAQGLKDYTRQLSRDMTPKTIESVRRLMGTPQPSPRIDGKRFGKHARSGRPEQDFGQQATDMETGQPVDHNGRRVTAKQTVQDRVAMNEAAAASTSTEANVSAAQAASNVPASGTPPQTSAGTAAQTPSGTAPQTPSGTASPPAPSGSVESGASAAPNVAPTAQETKVLVEAGEGAASKGVLQRAAKVAASVLRPLKVVAKVAEKAAAPVAVAAVVYETATEQGTGMGKDKPHFQVERTTGGTLVAAAAMVNPVTAIAGGWAINAKIEVDKTFSRENQRMSKQSVDLKHAKSAAYRFHDELVAKGATFGPHWSFDFKDDHNRKLLRDTLQEKAGELEKRRDASKPWFSFGKAKERYRRPKFRSELCKRRHRRTAKLRRRRGASRRLAEKFTRGNLPSGDDFAMGGFSFSNHQGDPLPPAVPGGSGGRRGR